MIVFHICIVNRHQIASLSLDFVMDFLCTSLNRFTCCSIFWIKRTHTHRACPALEGKTSIAPRPAWKILAGGWPLQPARTIAPVFACILEIGQSEGAYTVDARRFFLAAKEGMPFGCCHMLCFERRTCRFQMLYGLWTPKLRWTVEFSSRTTCWMTWWLQEISVNPWHSCDPPCIFDTTGGSWKSTATRRVQRSWSSWDELNCWKHGRGDWGLWIGRCLGVWIYGDFMVILWGREWFRTNQL